MTSLVLPARNTSGSKQVVKMGWSRSEKWGHEGGQPISLWLKLSI
jgi:hypothetical protein